MPRVETVPLGFDTLVEIDDGRIDKLLRMHLQRIAQDCMDRPGDKSKRQVALVFTAEPVVDDHGGCEYAKIEIEAKSKVPVHRSKPYEMRCTKSGFLFNQDFPEDLDQTPLPFEDRLADEDEGQPKKPR